MDKKLTDKDIVKALECCSDEETLHGCTQCPYYDKENDFCQEDLHRDTLDLINRLQEEKEALINGQETLQKYIADLQAENDDFKFLYENLKSERLETIKAIKYHKSEAYKEFAERLKENSIATFSFKGVVMVEEIDNLLKEMVGEDK